MNVRIKDLLKNVSHKNLADFIIQSRISGRVMKDLEQSNLLTEEQKDQIKEDYIRACKKNKDQIKSIQEIQDLFKTEKKPMIIKGPSAAILCNSTEGLRRSNDLDMFYDDIDALKKALISIGYKAVQSTTSAHEDSLFLKDRIFIEIHKYFPVLMDHKYNQSKYASNLQLASPDISFEEITYDELIKHSCLVNNEIAQALMMTDTAMTSFITACHMYKNLFWEPYRLSNIRLCEIYELYDLIRLDSFNVQEFNGIVSKFNARHITNYIFSIVETVTKEEIPIAFERVTTPVLKLMNASYSPYVVTDRSYFERLPYLDFNELINRIGYENCYIRKLYSTSNLEHVHYASMTENVTEFLYDIDIEDTTIVVCFHVLEKIEHHDNFFVMSNDNQFAHLWVDHYPDRVRLYGYNVRQSIVKEDQCFNIYIRLLKPDRPVISLVLAMGRIDNDENKNVTVLPIKIINGISENDDDKVY